jgi:hypothetical protein
MKTRALILVLPLVALAVAGCSRTNHSSVEIQAICAMTDDCKFQTTCTNTLMGNPIVDAAMTGSIWVPIQMQNQLPNNKDLTRGQVNTNDAHIDEYVLEYEGGGFGTVAVPTNQIVPANGTTVILVELVPAVLGAQAALASYSGGGLKALQINLRVRGYYDDGSRFETGEFPIALWVCTGCIGACPTGTSIKCPASNPGQAPRSCG